MAIDFTFPDEVEDARLLVKRFMGDVARPRMAELSSRRASGDEWRQAIKDLRQTAREQGLWAPHMPEEWGGMGLGVTAVAAMSAEAVKTNMGPYLINCQAPDEGNMHTLLHFGTDEQKEKWLKPLCEGTMRSCFSMTEPEVAGSDPTQSVAGDQVRALTAEVVDREFDAVGGRDAMDGNRFEHGSGSSRHWPRKLAALVAE